MTNNFKSERKAALQTALATHGLSALAVLAYLYLMMLFNSSYLWLSTLPFFKKALFNSLFMASNIQGNYRSFLFIPCNLQNSVNHPLSVASLMLKLCFNNCNLSASEQKCCCHSHKYSVQLPFALGLIYNWIDVCFVSQKELIYFLISLLLLYIVSYFLFLFLRAKLKSLDPSVEKGGWTKVW